MRTTVEIIFDAHAEFYCTIITLRDFTTFSTQQVNFVVYIVKIYPLYLMLRPKIRAQIEMNQPVILLNATQFAIQKLFVEASITS